MRDTNQRQRKTSRTAGNRRKKFRLETCARAEKQYLFVSGLLRSVTVEVCDGSVSQKLLLPPLRPRRGVPLVKNYKLEALG
ncbi:hypothetical protein F2P81_023761 [Scophthalmus maximus]|uniref:Uncharacterized protein n=1 Tax=Scophthalmus maximus TaxID=52904 RepID=A0A6A4RVG7_SCOMX|nr:hypothetical protein F2P81_023761 [Scophthalmus maximus]